MFTATTLDTTLTPSTDQTLELQRDGTVSFSFTLGNVGQLPTSNSQTLTTIIASNSTIAGAIVIGNNMPAILNQIHGDTNTITYTFFVYDTNYDLNIGSSVTFKIRNNSWAQGQTPGVGFTDTEEVQITLTVPTPVFQPASTFLPGQNTDELPNFINEYLE